jgi:hypothetical protein
MPDVLDVVDTDEATERSVAQPERQPLEDGSVSQHVRHRHPPTTALRCGRDALDAGAVRRDRLLEQHVQTEREGRLGRLDVVGVGVATTTASSSSRPAAASPRSARQWS